MNVKQIVGIVALVLMMPSLIGLIVYSFNVGLQSPENNTGAAANLLVDAVTPWWIELIETLAGWGAFGAIIIIIFFLLLKKYPELQ